MQQEMLEVEEITKYGDSIPRELAAKYPNTMTDVRGHYFARKMKSLFKTPSKIYFGSEWNVCDRESYDSVRCAAIIWNELDPCIRSRIKRLKIMEMGGGRYNNMNRNLTINTDCMTFPEVFDLIHHEIGHHVDFEYYSEMTDEMAVKLIGVTKHASRYNFNWYTIYGDEYPARLQYGGKYSYKWKKEIFAEVYRVWMLERLGMELRELVSIDKYKLAKEYFEPIFQKVHLS